MMQPAASGGATAKVLADRGSVSSGRVRAAAGRSGDRVWARAAAGASSSGVVQWRGYTVLGADEQLYEE